MGPNKVGYWLQVGANIGILAGLVLVGLQMQQSIDLTRLQLEKQDAQMVLGAEQHFGGENPNHSWQKAVLDPDSMSLADFRAVEGGLWGYFVIGAHNNYRLHQMGLIDDERWRSQVSADAPFALGFPYARAWWLDIKQKPHIVEYLGEEFIAQVDAAIEDQPVDYVAANYDRILELLKSMDSTIN